MAISVPLSKTEVRKWLSRIRSQGDYFLFSRSHVKAFGRNLALFLSDIMNISQMHANEEGWFECSIERLRKSLQWEDKLQKTYLNKLSEMGVVETKLTGLPRTRKIRIDFVLIEEFTQWCITDETPRTATIFSPGATIEVFYKDKRRSNSESAPQTSGESLKMKNKGVDPVGFLDRMGVKVNRQDKSITKFDLSCAVQLRKAVVLHAGVQTYSHQPKKWANDFRILRSKRELGVICSVLDWLESNAEKRKKEKKFFPINAKIFRDYFDRLKEEMDKDKSTVEISPEAEGIVQQLKHYHWPKGSQADLPVAVQITFDGFTSLSEKLRAFCEQNPERIKVSKTETRSALGHVTSAHYLLRNLRPTSRTEEWFRLLFNRIHDWKDWNGNILTEAFDGNFHNPKLAKVVVPFIASFSGNEHAAQRWEEILQEIE